MKRNSLFIMSLSIGLISCESSYNSEYFPQQKGMTWFYHVNQFTMTEPVDYKMITTSHGMKNIDGNKALIKQLHTGEFSTYQFDEQGLYRLFENREKKPVFLFPLQKNTEWHSIERPYLMERSIDEINAQQNSMPGLSLSGPLSMTYTITNMDESIQVPAGRFNGCMKIEGKGTCSFSSVGSFARKIDIDVHHHDWYCPNVGLVKVERREESQRVSLKSVYYTIELERFTE